MTLEGKNKDIQEDTEDGVTKPEPKKPKVKYPKPLPSISTEPDDEKSRLSTLIANSLRLKFLDRLKADELNKVTEIDPAKARTLILRAIRETPGRR